MPAPSHVLAFTASLAGDDWWHQVADLGIAFGLASLVGLERELRFKAAGLRTHALVGLGAALFMLVSKYGFDDMLGRGVSLDPSRVAAQIVTGIGFIGGGLIFVRRDAVRGLTTAAAVWLTAAIGAAAGAGLVGLAALATLGHFAVTYGLGRAGQRLPRTLPATRQVRLTYAGGAGSLRLALAEATRRGYTIEEVQIDRQPAELALAPTGTQPEAGHAELVAVALRLQGVADVAELSTALGQVPGVIQVWAGDETAATE